MYMSIRQLEKVNMYSLLGLFEGWVPGVELLK
jgi:hypothetical protein